MAGSTSAPLKVLLAAIVDYAGLFPPASLSMAEAVANYSSYLRSDEAWALGRFIVPVARLEEFERAASPHWRRDPLWRVSVLAGTNLREDLVLISRFNTQHNGSALIDTVEAKASSVEEIRHASAVVPEVFHLFFEIPVQPDPSHLVHEIGRTGRLAKVRTGGVTRDAFPAGKDLARFLRACVSESVPFKATAGLHHPIRAEYSLTYQPGSERGMMYGYLNVFLAAAFLKAGMSLDDAADLLEEQSPGAFRFDDNGVAWRSYRISTAELKAVREKTALSFGSCSFREPMDDLKTLPLASLSGNPA